jgi:NAD(P)-dependent dehydrogenase (short-subunit alcohol dehydrogenase family)
VSSSRHVAVVTGGASGVGKATADLLTANGVSVVAVDQAWTDGDLHEGIDRIAGDVTDGGTWSAALMAAERLGGPTMLVINAAKLVIGTVLDVSEEDFRAVIEVNVFGAVKALKATLPRMIERGGGSIVVVASTASLFAEQALAAYATSKGGILQLIRSVAVDHARQGIRANAVCPGAIDTPFFRQHVDSAPDTQAFLKEKTDRHPDGRILQPEDVARLSWFLLSDASIGMNGASVMIDGGLTATFDFEPIADNS